MEISAKDPKKKDGKQNYSKITITDGGIVSIESSRSIVISSPDIIINGAKFEANSDQVKITATKQGCFQSQDLTMIASNSMTGASPSINMDASTGKFIAKGMSGQPLFAT